MLTDVDRRRWRVGSYIVAICVNALMLYAADTPAGRGIPFVAPASV